MWATLAIVPVSTIGSLVLGAVRLPDLTDLRGLLDLIVKDVGMGGAEAADARQLRDIARRTRVGEQGDPRPRHQRRASSPARIAFARRAKGAAAAGRASRFGMIFLLGSL